MPDKTLNQRNNMVGSTLNDALFWLAKEEVKYGDIRQGLWEKALAITGGDEVKARSEYLKLRVKSLHEIEITQPTLTATEIDENDFSRITLYRSVQQDSHELNINELARDDNPGLWPKSLKIITAIFVIFSVFILIGFIGQ